MIKTLIGYNGLVGSSLNQIKFQNKINSSNINEFIELDFISDILYIAAGDARKWYAGKNPEKFQSNSNELISKICRFKAKKVIHFSTIDVYDGECDVDETISPNPKHPYGITSLHKEQAIEEHFDDVITIRLPGLYSKNLTKNLIFDIVNRREDFVYSHNLKSTFQYLNLAFLDKEVDKIIEKNNKLINLVNEPISVEDIIDCSDTIGFNKNNFSSDNLFVYDVKSSYYKSYFLNRVNTIKDLKLFFNG